MILRSSFKDVESQTIDIAQILSVQALNATAGEAVNLYIAGDGYRITGEALGFSFDKQAVSELGLYDPEIFQLVRHVPSNTFYFERVVLGTFQNDTQLAEHYELSNPDDVTYVMVWMPPWKGIIMCRGDVAVTSQK